jgi:hypothetical protein
MLECVIQYNYIYPPAGCFVLRILPDSVTSVSDQCAYFRKADTWSMERLLSQRMGPQGEQNAATFSIRIDDYQWSCADTIVAKLHPCHLRVYWTVLRLQLVVCSQTTKSEKTEVSSRGPVPWGTLDAPECMLHHIHWTIMRWFQLLVKH